MSSRLIQVLIVLALVVGSLAIATWVSREMYYFFSNLLGWMRYNIGQMAIALFIVAVVGYFIAKK